MKFYVPEWDDAVDAHYDFIYDEHSILEKGDRDRHFIWDIFEYDTTPVDGVLISREQIEGSRTKFDRIMEYGVYNDPKLSIPQWLPTISDCGAWGYKSLPFPRYGNEDMLEFYEEIDVSVGVTIDHLVLGSGKKKGRLYLDERSFNSEFKQCDLPTELSEQVDIMVDEWPIEWPELVSRYDPSICDVSEVDPFTAADFEGSVQDILKKMDEDPRAVYRVDDKQVRYQITLDNAREIRELYERGDWSFRLMAAIQGWNPEGYRAALDEVLEIGYQSVGIGGVAGSQLNQIEEIVTEVGDRINEFQSTHNTRIDGHVFGFAKTDGFETIGRTGMSSIDSASMLRAAWTGGNNYHLSSDERYDAIRVRYASPRDDIDTAIKKSLHGQEVLHTLRAYDDDRSISESIYEWYAEADAVLDTLVDYLETHRHDEQYDVRLLNEVTTAFREDFEHGRELQASFSDEVRRRIVKLLRDDQEGKPVDFDEYLDIIGTAREVLKGFPRVADRVERFESDSGDTGVFKHVWMVLKDYATSKEIDDGNLLNSYRETLQARPWENCNCPICEDLGIEVAIFRGNNRNRRRGFHNMYRFHKQFERELPKILIVAGANSSFEGRGSVEDYLRNHNREFWTETHDLPIAEIGVVDANGVHEWWADKPERISLDPLDVATQLEEKAYRYNTLIYYDPNEDADFDINEVQKIGSPEEIRDEVLQRVGYEADFFPNREIQIELDDF